MRDLVAGRKWTAGSSRAKAVSDLEANLKRMSVEHTRTRENGTTSKKQAERATHG
jgi:hypothetical protein